jgi:purine-binding chemotaxis protein CheW
VPAEVLALLERRAERLREAPAQVQEEAVVWLAELPLGEDRYALPLADLRAAVPLRMVTPVPLGPPHVIGILRFQGQVLTALSLSSLLGGHAWREDPAVLLVVDGGQGRLVALDCEQIPRPLAVPRSVFEEAQGRFRGGLAELALFRLKPLQLIDLSGPGGLLGRVRGGGR